MVRVLKGRIEVRARRGWLRLVLWADAGVRFRQYEASSTRGFTGRCTGSKKLLIAFSARRRPMRCLMSCAKNYALSALIIFALFDMAKLANTLING